MGTGALLEDLQAQLKACRRKQMDAQDEAARLRGAIDGPHGWRRLTETYLQEVDALKARIKELEAGD